MTAESQRGQRGRESMGNGERQEGGGEMSVLRYSVNVDGKEERNEPEQWEENTVDFLLLFEFCEKSGYYSAFFSFFAPWKFHECLQFVMWKWIFCANNGKFFWGSEGTVKFSSLSTNSFIEMNNKERERPTYSQYSLLFSVTRNWNKEWSLPVIWCLMKLVLFISAVLFYLFIVPYSVQFEHCLADQVY